MHALVQDAPVDTTSAIAAELEATLAAMRLACAGDPYPDAERRRDWLSRCLRALKDREQAIVEAIDADFGGRSATETRLLELFPSLEGIKHARRHLKRWMRPERRGVSFWYQPARARLHYQPLGVVGIIVPWNYPLFLAVGPLVAALAAGNRVMLKMSEYTPAFGRLFAELMHDAFPDGEVRVVNGGPDVAQAFSRLPFDHLLFTGSTAIGREVMRAASANLTPVTLELGGKSPVLVAPGFDTATAATRIALGKLFNAGQTCVAPDYVLLPEAEVESFLKALGQTVRRFYGDGTSPDYSSIINERQAGRLRALVEDAQAQGATLHRLLDVDTLPGNRLVPMALTGVSEDMRILQEEIFGPLLPIVSYRELDEAVAYINRHDRPLALYLFDDDGARVQSLLRRTLSGGVTVNDCMLHVGQDNLPFGGVGPSGMGHYHAVEGFRTFSKARGVLYQSRFNTLPFFHPPYGWLARLLLKVMLR